MSATTYTVEQYLLDRVNIQDVIEMLYIWFDTGDYDKMKTQVFADNVEIDFTSFWGGKPFTESGLQLAERWEHGLQSKAASAQHVVSSVVPQLPQPGASEIPNATEAIANGSTFIKSMKGNLLANTGRLYTKLIRLQDPPAGVNPWRISGLKAEVVWENEVRLQQLAEDYEEYHAEQRSEAS